MGIFEFGKEQAEKYGDQITAMLSGKTVSKSKALAEMPGGLIYEAKNLGIEWQDLLQALEGMCRTGRAREIDDSTYLVCGKPRNWTDYLQKADCHAYSRLCVCKSRRDDLQVLVNTRWLYLQESGKAKKNGYTKEDAVIQIMEYLGENGQDNLADLPKYEYLELAKSHSTDVPMVYGDGEETVE